MPPFDQLFRNAAQYMDEKRNPVKPVSFEEWFARIGRHILGNPGKYSPEYEAAKIGYGGGWSERGKTEREK